MTRTVWMVGHSNWEWSAFVHLLEKHQIAKLIDVRSVPYSRFPHFNHGFMKHSLPLGMYELWPVLGGHQQFKPPAVKRALRQLLDRVNGDRLCLTCSEGAYRLWPSAPPTHAVGH